MLTIFVTTIAFTLPIFSSQASVSKLEESLISQLINPQLPAGGSANGNAIDVPTDSLKVNSDTDQTSFLHNYSRLLDSLIGSSASQSALIPNRLSSLPGQWLLVHYPLVDTSEKRDSQSFTPWAGKRARPFEQSKGVFHSWAGKRSATRPFSNWAGKRSLRDEVDDIHSTR